MPPHSLSLAQGYVLVLFGPPFSCHEPPKTQAPLCILLRLMHYLGDPMHALNFHQ